MSLLDTDLLTRDQAANALTISSRTLDRLTAAGAIAVVKIGGSVRIARAELTNYLDRRTVRRGRAV